MQRFLPSLFLIPLALLLGGCFPVERFWWSPEGDCALVRVPTGLALANREGEIVEEKLVALSGKDHGIDSVAWLPEGSGFLIAHYEVMESWEEAVALLSEDEVVRIENLAEVLPGLCAALLAVGGDTENIGEILNRLESPETAMLRAALMLSLHRDPEAWQSLPESAPQFRAGLARLATTGPGYVVHRLERFTWSGKNPQDRRNEIPAGEVLLGSVAGIRSVTVAPDGKTSAFGRRTGDGQVFALEAVSLETLSRSELAPAVHPGYAWTNDSRSLIAVVPVMANDGLLKQIQRIPLGDGSQREATGDPSKPETLATSLISFAPRVEILPDDSVLFAGQSVGFPSQSLEAMPDSFLYQLFPDTRELTRVPTREGMLPMNLGHFVLSPSGRRVAVVESDSDAVAVIDLRTGDLTILSGPTRGWKCRTVPAWRETAGRDELTFAALSPDSESIRWMLWREGQEPVPLSRSWSAERTSDWLDFKDPDEAQNPGQPLGGEANAPSYP